ERAARTVAGDAAHSARVGPLQGAATQGVMRLRAAADRRRGAVGLARSDLSRHRFAVRALARAAWDELYPARRTRAVNGAAGDALHAAYHSCANGARIVPRFLKKPSLPPLHCAERMDQERIMACGGCKPAAPAPGSRPLIWRTWRPPLRRVGRAFEAHAESPD